VLSGHKETPKLFWGKPDDLQVVYHAVSDYLDLDERADVLNRRFTALTDMLDLLRDQQCTRHEEHLEWIVICLILVRAPGRGQARARVRVRRAGERAIVSFVLMMCMVAARAAAVAEVHFSVAGVCVTCAGRMC
jgi:hypothetical protein